MDRYRLTITSIDPEILIDAGIWMAIAILIIYLVYQRFFNSKHQRNVRKAAEILEKIRNFRGDHVNQRIFAYLRKIDPFVFEEMILTCFKEAGCRIIRNKRYSGDGGIDGRVMIDHALHLVQCKRYENHIDRKDVQDLNNKVKQHRAKCGFFVHTGKTGAAAKEWHYPNVKMISGERLITLLFGKYPFETA